MKRGNQNRRARRARPITTSDRRRTIVGLPALIVCVLLVCAGSAALWAVEDGVVTSAPADPTRIGAPTTSSPVRQPAVTPPSAQEVPSNLESMFDRLRARARSAFGSPTRNQNRRNDNTRDHDAHDHDLHDHDSHEHHANNGDSRGNGGQPTGVRSPLIGRQDVGRQGFGRRSPSNVEDTTPTRQQHGIPVHVESTDVDLEFWVEWGGGEPRSWFGTLKLDQGQFATARGYGLQADAPGSIYLKNNVVTISPRLARSFDSVLVRITAPLDANLLVTFLPNGSSTGGFESKFAVMDLVKSTQHRRLDDRDNKLIIRRTLSDSLRLQTDRTSMVFEPTETFSFSVLPNLIDFEDLQHQVRVELRPARQNSSLWVDEREVEEQSGGSMSKAGPFKLTMPSEEGVYDLIISINKRRSFSVSQPQVAHWRKLQVVVVQSESDNRSPQGNQRSTAGEQFQVIQEFDPAAPEQLLATGTFLSSYGGEETKRRPMLHGQIASVVRLEKDMLRIGTDSWFALPLQVGQPGHPHVVEIDYPNDAEQTFGIAIYEPGSRRAVVDVGLTTSADNLVEKPGVATYRLTFWPKSTTPILVLSDRDSSRVATIGAVRVLAGPDHLGSAETQLPTSGRLLAAHLTTPLFPELFSATSDVDQQSGRKLRDWVTFFDGAKRLIQLLRHHGYNGAVIPVLADGGSLYPSRILEPTPLYDDGVFFATAQDPMQKDVLEMLLRMFDSAGLRLVPSIKFTGTLPILEAKRRLGGSSSINLVNTTGKRWRPQPGSYGVGSHYNPLDQDVQAAMRAVVSELSRRCAPHASFAGVAIQLDPLSYATFPGPDWGADDATLTKFMAAQTPSSSKQLSEQRLRQEWLAWRADRLADMYHEMFANLRNDVPRAKLYLLGSQLLDTPQVKNASAATRVPDGLTASSALLSFGINVARIREEGVVFLSPRQEGPVLSGQVDIDQAWSAEYARLFGPHAESETGSLLHYPIQVFDVETLAGKLPIKGVAQTTKTRVGATGALRRRGLAQGLASLDSQSIFDGAWQTPGDEQIWRNNVTIFRRLPRIKFETVSPLVGSKTQPVVVRRGVRGSKVFFYLVNDSPHPVVTKIGFAGRPTLQLKSLSTTNLPRLVMTEQGPILPLTLRPYEIVGMEASEPNARIVRWETEVDQLVLKTQHQNLQRLQQCVDAKRAYPQLENPDFEQEAAPNKVPGWEFSEGAGIYVHVDTHASRQGRQSLHLQSEPPVNWSNGPVVWLRSQWFVPATSGRLIFAAWLKTRDFDDQPHVRLLIEGRLPDNQLIRRERVLGAAQNDASARPLGADWNYYAVFAERLPANVKEVRVGIDLRGTGDVWVDHVGVYDIWLNEQEQAGLNRDIGISTSMLREGRVSDSEQLLKSHYTQFLFANFPGRLMRNDPTPALRTIDRRAPASATIGDVAPIWPKIRDSASTRSTFGETGRSRPTPPEHSSVGSTFRGSAFAGSTITDDAPIQSSPGARGPAPSTFGSADPPRSQIANSPPPISRPADNGPARSTLGSAVPPRSEIGHSPPPISRPADKAPARSTIGSSVPPRSEIGHSPPPISRPADNGPARSTFGSAGQPRSEIGNSASPRSTFGDNQQVRPKSGQLGPARVTGPARATIGDAEDLPPSEPDKPISSNVTAWPDFGQQYDGGARNSHTGQGSEPATLRGPSFEYATPIADGTYPVTDRPYPVTNSRGIGGPPPRAEPEPTSWFDKLKSFKLKLPTWKTQSTR